MLAIWGIAVVVALILVGTSLSGLTTSAHVVGTTQSSQAEALYHQAMGASASQRPTDVIVVSSKSSTVSDGSFLQFVARLAAQVRTAPGVTHVATDLNAGSQFVSSDQHAALIALRAPTTTADPSASAAGDLVPMFLLAAAIRALLGGGLALHGSFTGQLTTAALLAAATNNLPAAAAIFPAGTPGLWAAILATTIGPGSWSPARWQH